MQNPRTLAIFLAAACAPSLFATTNNLAPAGVVSSSDTAFGGLPEFANDGNRDGVFANQSVFHSENGAGSWIEVDLGREFFLDRILLFPRSDQRQFSMRDFTIEIFDAAESLVWSESFLPEAFTNDDPWGTAAMSGQTGRRIRLTLNDPNFSETGFFTFSEFEVWGSTAPIAPNIALTATVTASAPGFGASISNGIDDDLGSNFFANTDADGPVYHDEVAAEQGFYRLDFGRETPIGEVQLYNRVLNNVPTTTLGYRVSILDSDESVVTFQEVTPEAQNYDSILQFGGARGSALLIEELESTRFLAFSEVRVFSSEAVFDNGLIITSIQSDQETGELTLTANVAPNTSYFLESSSDLQTWVEAEDGISSDTNTATFTFTPAPGTERQFYRLSEGTAVE